jgi:hypothetical protein
MLAERMAQPSALLEIAGSAGVSPAAIFATHHDLFSPPACSMSDVLLDATENI